MNIPAFEQHLICDRVQKGGHGAYDELIIGETVFAGRVHYDDPNILGMEKFIKELELECCLLANLRHPHIVQFIGICFFEEIPHPVFVMEKLDTNLDALLNNEEQLSLSVKFSILLGVSKALVYLHHGKRDPIVHKDLTSCNVLISIDSMNVKIAGIRGVSEPTLKMALYMPPEAYGNMVYSTLFSFGHLALYTLNQRFPSDLLPPTYYDRSNKLQPRNEVERRGAYINQLHDSLGPDHVMMIHIVKLCLSNKKEERYSNTYQFKLISS